jgi:hypothetical protein
VLARPGVEHFATVAVAIYDRRGSELTYALAGHPPPILRRVGAPEPLTVCCSPPVGWSQPTGRRQSKVTLPPGSEVVFFTDGLVEARADGGLLGRDGLASILEELGPHAHAQAVLEHIQETTDATRDDMAACVLSATATEVTDLIRIEELEADGNELRGESVRRFLHECGVDREQSVRARRLGADIAGLTATAVIRVEAGRDGIVAQALAPAAARDEGRDEDASERPAGGATRRFGLVERRREDAAPVMVDSSVVPAG